MERWSGKRYHSWSWHLQSVFGEKVAKISLDAGFTCPHRRGTSGGCIYCSPGAAAILPVRLERQYLLSFRRWPQRPGNGRK